MTTFRYLCSAILLSSLSFSSHAAITCTWAGGGGSVANLPGSGVNNQCSMNGVSGSAASVNWLSDDRKLTYIGGDDYGSYSNTRTPGSPFGLWDQYYGQDSTIGSFYMHGDGSGDAYSDYDWYENQSIFDVTFSVNSTSNLLLDGSLSTYGLWGGGAEPYVSLYEDGQRIYHFSGWNEYQSFEHIQFLSTGKEYRLLLHTNVWPVTDAQWDFEAAVVTAVPVPAAAWLFGSAIIGLAGIKRKA